MCFKALSNVPSQSDTHYCHNFVVRLHNSFLVYYPLTEFGISLFQQKIFPFLIWHGFPRQVFTNIVEEFNLIIALFLQTEFLFHSICLSLAWEIDFFFGGNF